MARNGSGTYSLPAGNPVVTGTTISSTWANTTLSDIATALTNSLAKDGQTPPTANLPMGGFRHTGVDDAVNRTDYAVTGQIQDGSYIWCGTAGGTVDAITLTPSPAITAYAAGQKFAFISSGANTGAVTVEVSGISGAEDLTKLGATALSAGDIPADAVVEIRYDGTQFQTIGIVGTGAFNAYMRTFLDSASAAVAVRNLELPTAKRARQSEFGGVRRVDYAAGYVSKWTARTPATVDQWRAVCYSTELERAVAVSLEGTAMYSDNGGINWTSATTIPEANQWHDVTWAPELGLYVAIASTGTNRIMTSPDGDTWTASAAPEANQWRYICWAPELGLLVATSFDGTNRIMTSPDGTSWTARAAPEANQWNGVCWAPELGLLVSVADSGTNRVMTSDDGITWSAVAASEASGWRDVCYSPERRQFVAVASTGTNLIMASSDGSTWASSSAPTVGQWYSVMWCSGLGRYVMTALDGGNQFASSPTASTGSWTGHKATSPTQWAGGMAWADDFGRLIAVALNGAVSTSATAADWVVEGTRTMGAYGVTAGQFGDAVTIALPAGTWDITGQMLWLSNGATTTTLLITGLSDNAGNDGTDLTAGNQAIYGTKNGSSGSYDAQSVTLRATVTGSGETSWYLKVRADTSITNLQYAGKIIARRAF